MPKGSDTATNRIYKELRRGVIVGHFKPGERLSIEGLAKRFGTSITPVRDALQMLSQEGLITNKPRSGFFIPYVTLKELRDMLELREILEVAAVERAVSRITKEELDALDQVHAGYNGDDEASYERYITENRRLHYLIAKASRNERLADMVGHLLDQLLCFVVTVHTGQEMEKRHKRLIKALRSRDMETARQVILDEVRETQEITLEHAIQQEGANWRLKQLAIHNAVARRKGR